MLFIPETVIFVHSAWHFQGPSMSYNTHARQLDWQLNITRWRVSGESNIYYNYFFYKLHKLVFINDDFNQYILKEWVKQSLNNTTYTIRRFYTFENWKFTRHKKWAVMQNSKLCEIQRVLQHKNYQKRKRNVSDCVYNLKKVDYGILHLGASNSSFLKLWNKTR